MKIYNEIVTIFNELTGQWETISEDSFNYNGPVAFAQGLPPGSTAINTSDTIADTIKTTAGYFTNGDGTLSGTDVFTGSLSATNQKYYFNVNHLHPLSSSTTTQFSLVFGDVRGSGSDTYGDSANNPNTLNGETEVIYRSFASLLLTEIEASGGFKIAQSGTDSAVSTSLGSGLKDEYIYAIVGKRNRFKDRINKKAWTLTLSGSKSDGTAATTLNLTDDSSTVAAAATPGGPRYNIVEGTLGTATQTAAVKTYGWFYPEMGIMLFSGAQLSASMPGATTGTAGDGYAHNTASLDLYSGYNPNSSGFAPNLYAKGNPKNALRFAQCMRNMGSSTTLRLRSEEDQTQENYFCRIRATEYNFSANPTFTSGSKNKIRNTDMFGNPQTFITGVGLYNSAGQLLAISKLSSPLKKNFVSEATIKIKLTY